MSKSRDSKVMDIQEGQKGVGSRKADHMGRNSERVWVR